MKKDRIHFGCSSFSNGYWKGIFYPEDLPRKEWFAYYCQFFNTYEINATFYRFPTLKSLQAWHNKTPDYFIFSVKAPKIITHLKKFVDAKQEINAFYEICNEGLDKKLGPILFQLPPSYDFSEEKLTLIMDSLNPEFENIVEFRNQSWWNPQVYEAFSKNNIVFCSVSYPNLSNEIIVTNGKAYVRLHGDKRLFYSSYDDAVLEDMYRQLRDVDKLEKAYVYFNNTAGTAGILNALSLKKIIKS